MDFMVERSLHAAACNINTCNMYRLFSRHSGHLGAHSLHRRRQPRQVLHRVASRGSSEQGRHVGAPKASGKFDQPRVRPCAIVNSTLPSGLLPSRSIPITRTM